MAILKRPFPSKKKPVTVPSLVGSMSRTVPASSVHVAASRVIVTPPAGSGTGPENFHICSLV
jgi:hypothetical protein